MAVELIILTGARSGEVANMVWGDVDFETKVWTDEATEYPRELAEYALAHRVGSAVERAYSRSHLVDKRRPLMEDWGRFVTSAVSS